MSDFDNLAKKKGTSNDFRNRWFNHFNPRQKTIRTAMKGFALAVLYATTHEYGKISNYYGQTLSSKVETLFRLA